MANETIKGKIFTLKDPTGNYNRFPRTVMEAVYGLNTYLQNQFSALADIYMPIEGITETKPLQEFVYRACPSSIKAKSVSLDRIYGKTLAWNQLVTPFDNTNWKKPSSASVSDGILTINGHGIAYPTIMQVFDGAPVPIIGHKYLIKIEAKGTTDNRIAVGIGETNGSDTAAAIHINASPADWTAYSGIGQITATTTWSATIQGRGSSMTVNMQFRNFMVLDLTLLYGSAIDGMTDAQILAKFESEFPGYHNYSAGKLISNDAESIETVGFNLWNEEMVLGTWEADGQIHSGGSHDNYIASAHKIPILSNTTYYVKRPTAGSVLLFFDAAGTLHSEDNRSMPKDSTFISPGYAHYIAFYLNKSDYGHSTYNHDICINLSDPAKNGTYEPYRKSTMQLNLGSFQVRDSQGNVTTITGGLKSAGSVKDEIVGNKYIQRVGSVDLGSLGWLYSSLDFFYVKNPFPVNISNVNIVIPSICGKYANAGIIANTDDIYFINAGDKIYTIHSRGDVNSTYVYIKDSAYSDATIFTTAMSGVMLNYELATPIEYELVSPLVPTVAAGITEARISPNADGLSASMVADMTYDAQANNDSASSQYALTAGRLLNSHKLWGQDFDGTQDVSGALTGVTNLNSLLYLGSSNVGIGQSSPAYKLDVNGTFRAAGAATFGSTISASGNISTTGQLISTKATGTAPLSVASTTRVANLNADLLDGYEASDFIATLQSLWSQIDSVATRTDFDLLNVTQLLADTVSASTAYLEKITVTSTASISGATTLGSTLSVAGLATLVSGAKLTTTKKIWFGDAYFIELDSNNRLHTNAPIVSDSFITAGAAAS